MNVNEDVVVDDSKKESLNFSRLTRQELEQLCHQYAQMVSTHEDRMKEVNELLCANLKEMRMLKEVNKKLTSDNKQLQDLCCFLDNDRIGGRKLAKEWQKFGKYSADVIKKEVPVYKDKLKGLEKIQISLLETMELFAGLMEVNLGIDSHCFCKVTCPIHGSTGSTDTVANLVETTEENNCPIESRDIENVESSPCSTPNIRRKNGRRKQQQSLSGGNDDQVKSEAVTGRARRRERRSGVLREVEVQSGSDGVERNVSDRSTSSTNSNQSSTVNGSETSRSTSLISSVCLSTL